MGLQRRTDVGGTKKVLRCLMLGMCRFRDVGNPIKFILFFLLGNPGRFSEQYAICCALPRIFGIGVQLSPGELSDKVPLQRWEPMYP